MPCDITIINRDSDRDRNRDRDRRRSMSNEQAVRVHFRRVLVSPGKKTGILTVTLCLVLRWPQLHLLSLQPPLLLMYSDSPTNDPDL